MKVFTKSISVLLFVAALFVTTGLNNVQANQGDEQHAIGVARGAAHECLAGTASNLNVNSYATFRDGTWYVSFWASPICPPNMICALYLISLANVQLDADFKVKSSSCGISYFLL